MSAAANAEPCVERLVEIFFKGLVVSRGTANSWFLINGHVRQGNIFGFGSANVFPDLDVIALAFGTAMCLCTCGRLAPQSAL